MTRILVAVLLLALPAAARPRAVRHPAPAKSVLWIAAHPDDEALAAPLLERWCVHEGARCGMLVLTRGEAGACLLPSGCDPDVRTVRSAEAAAASELFGADAILLRYPNGGAWDHAEVATRIAGYIEAFRPDRILTFDPRHGTTCHPEHRATGRAVLDARLTYEPEILLLETRLEIRASPFALVFSSATPAAERFDAAEHWNAVAADMQRHPSQFSSEWIAAVRNVPRADRAVFIAPAATILEQPVSACP